MFTLPLKNEPPFTFNVLSPVVTVVPIPNLVPSLYAIDVPNAVGLE